jgi:CRP-like cAMP-binding protein
LKGELVLTAAIDEVGRLSVFQGLTESALQDCADRAVRRSLVKGESIFHQGDRRVRLHALVAGWVRVLQAGPDGELSLIRFVGPGESFGAFAIFTGEGYPADASAAGESVELSWSAVHLRHLLERHPPIAVNLLNVAARRLAELQERVREISTQPADQRIANALLRLSRKGGEGQSDGSILILPPLARKDVAGVSRTTLYTASRVMSGWERKGIIETRRGRVSIKRLPQLQRIADGG